jgi:uncharacterized membrane protein YraQ (UPF0718 family)
MYIAFSILLSMTAILFIIAIRRKDRSHIRGLKAGKAMFIGVIPLLIFAFLLSGLIQVAIPTDIVKSWLGDESGWRGIIIGTFLGVLIPGGPYVTFPIIGAVFQAGAGIGTTTALITGWAVLGIGQIPFELALVGPRFMAARIGTCLLVPFLAGALAQIIFGIGF